MPEPNVHSTTVFWRPSIELSSVDTIAVSRQRSLISRHVPISSDRVIFWTIAIRQSEAIGKSVPVHESD